jgi:hypothetical protein
VSVFVVYEGLALNIFIENLVKIAVEMFFRLLESILDPEAFRHLRRIVQHLSLPRVIVKFQRFLFQAWLYLLMSGDGFLHYCGDG